MKLVKVSDSLHKKLFEKKVETGKGSVGEVIETLLILPEQKVMIKESLKEVISEERR